MSINAFQTQKVYYHTLDEGNCDSPPPSPPPERVRRDNGTIFFLFSSKLGVTFRCSWSKRWLDKHRDGPPRQKQIIIRPREAERLATTSGCGARLLPHS